jgi:DNA-directed RNA polymerase specialized sigma24 family protein
MWAGSEAEISAKASARSEKAWTLKQHGLSYQEIGVHLGLSASRARQIVQDGKRIEEKRKVPLSN